MRKTVEELKELAKTLRKTAVTMIYDAKAGHPSMNKCPGIDISTGSLGQGIAVANGMALAGKRDGKKYRTFVIVGDGECQEGQVWEAAEIAAKYELENLIVFVDNNGLQNDGACRDIMPTQDLRAKFEAFGWETIEIDGHNMEQILTALDEAEQCKGKPTAIVAHTVKGKGISFAENQVGFHNRALTQEEYDKALEELA